MPQPLLEGRVEPEEVTWLRREIVGLEAELKAAKDERDMAKQAIQDSAHVIRIFRERFGPFFEFLKFLFGEASRVDAGIGNASHASGGNLSPKWEMLKQKLGGRQAEFIDLLGHGEMTAAQLRAAAHCDIRTAYSVIEKMKGAGLVNKNGAKFSLKEI